MKTVKALGTMVLALTLILGAVTPVLGAGTAAAPKNVIIMIADGTGFNGYLAGDYYLKGEAGKQIFEQKDWVKLACSTYSLGNADTSDDGNSYYDPNAVWQDFNTLSKNATDSSAAATAICTGVKTFDYALGVDQDKQPLTGLVSEFESRGKATGVVSSVPLSHATPGAFISHNPNRNDYDGISKEAIWQGPCEVILGAGNPDYDDAGKKLTAPKYAYIGEDTWLKLTSGNMTGADANGDGKADSWTFIQEKADFDSIAAGKKVPDRLLGVAQVGSALQNYRAGLGMPMTTPFETPFNANVPDLAAMSGAALNVLNKDKDGFFLMIEGGATDWANHSGKGVSFIEEYADFVKAIETVSAWVEKNSSWNDTLLIVTADHETGYITHTKGEYSAVGNNGKGIMPTMTYNVGGHSNQLVPFFSKGAGADAFQTFADQNDPTIAKYFGTAFGINGDYLDNTEISAAIRTMIGIPVPDNKYPFKPTAAGYEVYAAPMTATALPSAQKVTVDGANVAFDAYNINGSNYFKLRDLAKVLSGSGKQFEVTFSSDKQAIDLVTGKPYTAVGGELTPGDGANKDAAKSTATVYIDGKQVTLLAYNIGGNNFFKLRSLGKTLDFSVTFDSATNSISVDTTKGYTA